MTWGETHGVDYVLGLARNVRWKPRSRRSWRRRRRRVWPPAPRRGCTRTSGTRPRRAGRRCGASSAKRSSCRVRPIRASWSRPSPLRRGRRPRCMSRSTAPVATWRIGSRSSSSGCLRIGTSTATLRGNQLRLWLASVAYVLVHELRWVGLRGTELARAQVTDDPHVSAQTGRDRPRERAAGRRRAQRRLSLAGALRPRPHQSPDRLPLAPLTRATPLPRKTERLPCASRAAAAARPRDGFPRRHHPTQRGCVIWCEMRARFCLLTHPKEFTDPHVCST